MKDLNWVAIFRIKEFNSYLTNNELIQLSLGCKAFRKCLSPNIFSNFDFTSFANLGDYKSCFVSRDEYKRGGSKNYFQNPFKPLNRVLTRNIARFKLDLDRYRYIPMKLVVYNSEYYYYLLYGIPTIFTNLTSMFITHSRLHYGLFQSLLDNINCLENLGLSNSSLIQCAQSTDIISIKWPDSLKKLKICKNSIDRVENKQTNIVIINNYTQSSSTGQPSFSLKHLPKLVSFEYQLFFEQSDDENLWEFLKINSQIMGLKIRVPDFHPELFAAIQCIDNLSNLHLEFMMYHAYEVDYNDLPILNNITCLTITLYDKPAINDIIIDKFPSLTELTVEMDSKDFYKLINLTKKLFRIKNLSLKINVRNLNIKEFCFPKLENLKKLKFILESDNYLSDVDWDAESCSSLKMVEFSKVKDTVYIEQPKLNPELAGCWKVVYFPHKATFFNTIYYHSAPKH